MSEDTTDANVQQLVDQAMAEARTPEDGSPAGDTATQEAKPVDMPDLGDQDKGDSDQKLELLRDVDLHVKIELGRTHMLVEDVLKLGEGSVVELDKLAGDPVDVYVNERLVARGEVLVLNDNFCIRISEIVSNLDKTTQDAVEAVGVE